MSRSLRPRLATGSDRLAAAAMLAVAGSWLTVRRGAGSSAGLSRFDDVLGLRWRKPRGTRIDRLVAATTDIGSVYGLAGTAGLLALTGRPRQAGDLLAAGAIAWSASQAVKPLLDRDRPYEGGLGDLIVHPPAGSSWPSGHTAVASAVGTIVADSGVTGAWSGLLTSLWVGWSRTYVGAHHPSDIVAGMGVGVLSAMTWRRIADLVRARLT